MKTKTSPVKVIAYTSLGVILLMLIGMLASCSEEIEPLTHLNNPTVDLVFSSSVPVYITVDGATQYHDPQEQQGAYFKVNLGTVKYEARFNGVELIDSVRVTEKYNSVILKCP